MYFCDVEGYTTYKIIPQLKLIITYFEGKAYLDDLIQLNKRFLVDELYDPSYDMLMDFSNSTAIAFRLDIYEYFDFMKKNVTLPKTIKNGILYSTSNQQFLISVYKPIAKLFKVNSESFKNVYAYFEWMGFGEEEREIVLDTLEKFKLKNKTDQFSTLNEKQLP